MEFEVQTRRGFEVAGLQFVAHGRDIVFQCIELMGAQRHGRQPRGEPLQRIAQLEDVQRRSLRRERPARCGLASRQLHRRLHEHAFARLDADHAQRTQR
ncbi:hypothetical protein D3C87_1653220 [compost metagenome]